MKTRHPLLLCLLFLIATTFLNVNAQDSFLPKLDSFGADLQPLARLGHGWPNDVVWSPDGQTLAVSSSVGVWLYDVHDLDTEPLLLQDDSDMSNVLAYSDDGKMLAAGGSYIRVWDTHTHQLLQKIDTNGTTESLDFSPDGQQLVSSNWFESHEVDVRLWDVQTGKQIVVLGELMYVADLHFSADGLRIAGIQICDCDLEVLIWDSKTYQMLTYYPAILFAFCPDQHLMAITGSQGSPELWNPDTNDPIALPLPAQAKNAPNEYTQQLVYTPDGRRVFSLTSLSKIRIWDVDTLLFLKEYDLSKQVSTMTISPDGKQVAAINQDTITIWDLATGGIITQRTGLEVPGSQLDFSPDGHLLASAGKGNSIWIWDMEMGKRVRELSGHQDQVLDIAFSPDGKFLLSGSRDNTARLWDAASGALLHTISAHTGPVTSVLFENSDGSFLTASDDSTIRFWDAHGNPQDVVYDAQNQLVNVLPVKDGVSAVTYTGDYVIVGNTVGTISRWRVETPGDQWEVIARDYARRGVNVMKYSDPDQWFAYAGDNHVVEIGDSQTGLPLGALIFHTHPIYALAFQPGSDGNWVASAGCAETYYEPWEGNPYCAGADLRLYDRLHDSQITVSQEHGHVASIRGAVFNPAGTILATSSADGTIILWGVPASG